MINKPNNIKINKSAGLAHVKNARSYRLVYLLKRCFDDWHIDPLIGFVIPGFGDLAGALFAVPYLYVAIVKVKSLSLSLAVTYNVVLDWLVGMIPVLGDIGDIFSKAYRKNYRLIVGFVEDDAEVVAEVKRKAVWSSVMIGVLVFVIALLSIALKWLCELLSSALC